MDIEKNIKRDEPLKNHSTFRIGGPAKFFVAVNNSDELLKAIKFAQDKNLAHKVIGGGSNILFSDEGYDGMVIKYFSGQVEFNGDMAECSAGAILANVLNKSLEHNLLGLEWAIGIPGTIGGAIHNNAGAYGGEMGQSVAVVKVLRAGEIIELNADECEFGYRSSSFKRGGSNDIIISATLKLRLAAPDEVAVVKEKIKQNLADRLSKSAEGPSAGSTFGNVVLSDEDISLVKKEHPELPDNFVAWKKIPAAWLIDQCELKGRQIGGAMVSSKHAGKITNVGGATAKDVIMLISIVKQKVRMKFNLQLMEEIEYIGF